MLECRIVPVCKSPLTGKMLSLLIFFMVMHVGPSHGARILAMVPMWLPSHHSVYQPILKTLAKGGHEVVAYTPYPLENAPPNYTHVQLKNNFFNKSKMDSLMMQLIGKPNFKCLQDYTLNYEFFEWFMKDEQMKNVFKIEEKFDLILLEVFMAQEFSAILSQIYKAPIIGLQAFQPHCILNRASGNSLAVSYIPDTCHPFSPGMTIVERFYNAYWIFRNLYTYYYDYLPKLELLMKQHFPDMPPLLDLMDNVSLTLVNTHSTAFYSQPLTPNIVPVGGIHLKPVKPLPEDLKTFFDGATDGFIYMSLGTYVPDDLMDQEYFDKYINVFKQLPQRILWKTRKQTIDGLPSNVKLVNWAPQQDILAHPNCVLFVTHGGQLSQIEAIHHQVPVVCVPYIYDQFKNAKFYEAVEIGLMVSLHELNTETILRSIQTVLKTPKYKENIVKLSRVFKDRPMSPSETVLYWTEYVLRHEGAKHLRPHASHMSWYQLFLLDILAIFAVVALVICLAILILVLYIMRKKGTNTHEMSKKIK